jgi:hypothetical protein
MSQLENIGDLMRAIQEDTEAVKSGAIETKTAQVVMRGRSLQVKLAEVVLQAARLTKSNGASLKLIAGTAPVEEET